MGHQQHVTELLYDPILRETGVDKSDLAWIFAPMRLPEAFCHEGLGNVEMKYVARAPKYGPCLLAGPAHLQHSWQNVTIVYWPSRHEERDVHMSQGDGDGVIATCHLRRHVTGLVVERSPT
jgi:hypothetical protein